MLRFFRSLLPFAFLLVVACDSGDGSSADPSFPGPFVHTFTASVSGDVAADLSGPASVATLPPVGGGKAYLSLWFLDSSNTPSRGITLARPSTERLAEQTYRIASADTDPETFSGALSFSRGDEYNYFTIQSGEIVVTETTEDMVKGTFAFDAVDAVRFDSSQRAVTVEGAFRALALYDRQP